VLEEARTSSDLAAGVVHTRIERGHRSADEFVTVDVALFTERSRAERTVRRLDDLGHNARIEVIRPRAPDDPRRGPTGYLVRAGRFESQSEADGLAKRLIADGFLRAAAAHTIFDGGETTGPWVVNVVDVNLRRFEGRVRTELGTQIVPGLERLTAIAARTDALAAVNGGFFVTDPADGTTGDLAGISVRNGALLSEAVKGRTSLLVSDQPRKSASIKTLYTRLRATSSDGRARLVDGVNRRPGRIRSCGGVGRDEPIRHPKHDSTCTDGSEVILFTREFGTRTLAGAGTEVLLTGAGRVIAVRRKRGAPIPAGGSVLAATGESARWLLHQAMVGKRIEVSTYVFSDRGRVRLRNGLGVINGGPRLLQGGRIRVSAFREGFVHRADPSFYVHFGLRRNPRTSAGITADGHLLLVTIDGRQLDRSIGASFLEQARVMKSLGAISAVNLDGGGSTAMTIGRELANRPANGAEERPIGDAVVLLASDDE
jgi:hypothetical protein